MFPKYLNLIVFLGNPGMGKRVVYGCTQLSSADHFLDQLVQLGTEVWAIQVLLNTAVWVNQVQFGTEGWANKVQLGWEVWDKHTQLGTGGLSAEVWANQVQMGTEFVTTRNILVQ